jgi:hypothetical protein
MWWFMVYADLDTYCDPDLLVTNLGHECVYEHIVVPKIVSVSHFTPRGPIGEEVYVCPADTVPFPQVDTCTRSIWRVVYTTIVRSENPYMERCAVMGKYGCIPHKGGPKLRCSLGKFDGKQCAWEESVRKKK